MKDVFTPLDQHRNHRLKFDMARVKVLSGRLDARWRGIKATVEIEGKRYNVHGISCGLPNCMCDAFIKEAK